MCISWEERERGNRKYDGEKKHKQIKQVVQLERQVSQSAYNLCQRLISGINQKWLGCNVDLEQDSMIFWLNHQEHFIFLWYWPNFKSFPFLCLFYCQVLWFILSVCLSWLMPMSMKCPLRNIKLWLSYFIWSVLSACKCQHWHVYIYPKVIMLSGQMSHWLVCR